MKIRIIIGLLLSSIVTFGQTLPTIELDKVYLKNLEKNQIDIVDKTYLYINDGPSNELFYYEVV